MKSSSESGSDSSELKTCAANLKDLAETLPLPFFDETGCFGELKALRVNNLGEEMGRRQLGPQQAMSTFATAVEKRLNLQGLSSSLMSCALFVGGLLRIPAECRTFFRGWKVVVNEIRLTNAFAAEYVAASSDDAI